MKLFIYARMVLRMDGKTPVASTGGLDTWPCSVRNYGGATSTDHGRLFLQLWFKKPIGVFSGDYTFSEGKLINPFRYDIKTKISFFGEK